MTANHDLQARVREVHARAAIQAWEYRQRDHAKGTWFRLRRFLAGTRWCWSVPVSEAELLIEEGFEPEPVGLELEPPKTLLVVPADRVSAIPGRRPLRVALTTELLNAACLVFVSFDRG